MVYILNHTNLAAPEICSYAFTDDCGNEFDRKHDWTVPVPEPKPALRASREPKASRRSCGLRAGPPRELG